MKVWRQAATGALVGAVGLALALLPGRLLKPEPQARPLALPRTISVTSVEARPVPVRRRRVAVRHAAPPVRPVVAALASAPVTALTPAPKPKPKPAPVHHAAPKPPVARHPRLFVEAARPAEAPAAPAPTAAPTETPTLTPTTTTPERTLADQKTSTPPPTTTTVTTPELPIDDHGHDHHDHDRGDGHGDGHGHGHGHGR